MLLLLSARLLLTPTRLSLGHLLVPQTPLASTDLSHSNFPAGCQEVINVPPAFGGRQLGLGEEEGKGREAIVLIVVLLQIHGL